MQNDRQTPDVFRAMTTLSSDDYIFPAFFAAAPRSGVTGRPVWFPAPYGNFFLSAGFNIYAEPSATLGSQLPI